MELELVEKLNAITNAPKRIIPSIEDHKKFEVRRRRKPKQKLPPKSRSPIKFKAKN